MKKIVSGVLAVSMMTPALVSCGNKGKHISGTEGSAEICNLTVNYTRNPVGIDDRTPLFGWIMKARDGERNVSQSAFELIVAKSEEELESEKGSALSSGKISSDRSANITFDEGFIPEERTRYYWTVRVWDNNGSLCQPQEPAFFETGLIDEGFEDAEWITAGAAEKGNAALDVGGASWIWLLNGAAFSSAPVGTELFRFGFNAAEGKTVDCAYIAYSTDDYGELYLNGELISTIAQVTDAWKTGRVVRITDIIGEKNIVAARVTNSSLGYGGLIAKIVINYSDGTRDTYTSDKSWRVSQTPEASFTGMAYNDDAWKAPDECVLYGGDPWLTNVSFKGADEPSAKTPAAPLFRKEFGTSGTDIVRARFYATAAGLYEAYINGKKVGADFLNPGRSQYEDHIMYQTFDVTGLVQGGQNCIGAMLGRGWYIGADSGYGKSLPAFLGKLVITYGDGSEQTVVTDGSWSLSEDGPITQNDIFGGESYDASREMRGWSNAGFDDSGWRAASVSDARTLGIGEIIAQKSGSIKVMDKVEAVKITSPSAGVYIIDFGQNLAGVVEFTLKGSAGQTVTLRHAEMLNDRTGTGDGKAGTIYTENLRSAKATDTYTFATDGEVTWRPTFTFHGFRYAEITGLTEKPDKASFTALVTYSDMEDTISFDSSSELLNKLFSNAYWGQRGNFLSTPTDCPQRDERMGWSGDAQVFAATAGYNMNTLEFFEKYLMDLNDCQTAAGAYPDVAPHNNRPGYSAGSGRNGWADAGIIIPWTLYEQYGDADAMTEYYPQMAKYIRYLVNDAGADFIRDTQNCFGDWLSIGESTPIEVTDTAYCSYVCSLMSKMAAVLGKEGDAARYAGYAESFAKAWRGKYLRDNGSTYCNTQTSYVLGLYFGLIPEELRESSAKMLTENIKKNGMRLKTGFLGVSYLLPVLCDNGYSDIAYKLLLQEEYPSWFYPVLQGATTVWERWNSYTTENGFGDAGMNSFNHYSYGSVMEWVYSYMAGIESCEGRAYKSFVLKPTVGEGVSFLSVSYKSVYGTVESAWSVDNDGSLLYNCTVPANTTATLYLPADIGDVISEGGKKTEPAGYENGRAIFELASGSYTFRVEG